MCLTNQSIALSPGEGSLKGQGDVYLGRLTIEYSLISMLIDVLTNAYYCLEPNVVSSRAGYRSHLNPYQCRYLEFGTCIQQYFFWSFTLYQVSSCI